LVNAKSKKTRTTREKEQASTKLANGMGGVTNEKGLKRWKMQKHMQANVKDGALTLCNVNEKQMQVFIEVGETSTSNLATIEVDL